jgi:hypothetical protein
LKGPRALLHFLFVWLMTGFAAGTLVLMGPVRWATDAARAAGWPQRREDLMVAAIIVVYVLGTAWLSWRLSRAARASARRWMRAGVPAGLALLALAALAAWMNPRWMSARQKGPWEKTARFAFGPYPTRDVMERIKLAGYTSVVPLLHPAVVPFEPKLLAEEKVLAAEFGLEVVHLPMLPWVSSNQQALERVRELALDPSRRYYVHCYLGRDRVNVVKRFVQSLGAETADDSSRDARRLADVPRFERGPVYVLEEGVFLGPYPTDEEYFGYLLTGQIETVVSLLDPDDPDDRKWIDKERVMLSEYGVPLVEMPLRLGRYDPEEALEAARRVREAARPVYVHAFLNDLSRSPAAQAFASAYASGAPPLVPSLYSEPLAGGPMTPLAPNAAAGPRPEAGEFGAVLHRRGVRAFLHLGDPASAAAREDQALCAQHGYRWQAAGAGVDAVVSLLRTEGGPWYLYGPGLAKISKALAEKLGPAAPALKRTGPPEVPS